MPLNSIITLFCLFLSLPAAGTQSDDSINQLPLIEIAAQVSDLLDDVVFRVDQIRSQPSGTDTQHLKELSLRKLNLKLEEIEETWELLFGIDQELLPFAEPELEHLVAALQITLYCSDGGRFTTVKKLEGIRRDITNPSNDHITARTEWKALTSSLNSFIAQCGSIENKEDLLPENKFSQISLNNLMRVFENRVIAGFEETLFGESEQASSFINNNGHEYYFQGRRLRKAFKKKSLGIIINTEAKGIQQLVTQISLCSWFSRRGADSDLTDIESSLFDDVFGRRYQPIDQRVRCRL